MDIQRAIDDVGKGKVLPVYVISGEERTMVARAVDALRKVTVGTGPRGLCEEHFEASEIRAARVIDACRMLPMLSKWRFVLVRSIGDWKAEDLDVLIPYLASPTPSTVLVMLVEKLDGRTRFATAAKKAGVVFEALPPPDAQLAGWLRTEAVRRGVTFGPGAADALEFLIGADLSALSDALDRLTIYAAGRSITTQDVDETIVNVRETSQFDLPDAVAEMDLPRGLSIAFDLNRQKAPALLSLAYIVGRVRLLARARDAMDRKEDVSRAFRLHPTVARSLPGWTRRWTVPQITRALRMCAQADMRLKSGGGKDRDLRVMEELLLGLAGGPGMGEAALRNS